MTSNQVERRYWDACTLIAFISGEAGRAEHCLKLLEEAQEQKHIVVTSAITLAEVTRRNGETIKQPNSMNEIERFFENDYFLFVPADRFVCQAARQLIWNYGIRANDAIHIASAHRARCGRFYTYDDKLLKLNGQIPELTVELPNETQQGELF